MVYGRDSSSVPPSDRLVDPPRQGAWRMEKGCRWSPGGARVAAAISASAGAVSGARCTTCHRDAPIAVAASEEYVATLLRRYLSLPGTPDFVRPADRRCARALYRRGVPLATAEAALVVAAARRTLRSPKRPPLAAIRALHYFLPVIEELLEQPLVPGYVQYLAGRLRPARRGSRSASAGAPGSRTTTVDRRPRPLQPRSRCRRADATARVTVHRGWRLVPGRHGCAVAHGAILQELHAGPAPWRASLSMDDERNSTRAPLPGARPPPAGSPDERTNDYTTGA